MAGRALRVGHSGFRGMPSAQATSAAFSDKPKYSLAAIPSDHPQRFSALKRAQGIPYNPFALM